jgi:predicted Fe-Mo cluster-binding NifX family protein
MRVALTIWEDRVSPVFDTARAAVLADIEEGKLVVQREEIFPSDSAQEKVARLRALGVDTLICGAISRPLAEMLGAAGIRVVPFVAGGAKEVLAAYLSGDLPTRSFAMPGCRCGQAHRFHGRRGNCVKKPQHVFQNIEPQKENE